MIGPVELNRPITLKPWPNGGVTVHQLAPEGSGLLGTELGAYSSWYEALSAIGEVFYVGCYVIQMKGNPDEKDPEADVALDP